MKVETLSDAERLQLANQFAMLEKLDPDQAERHARCREILENGYTIFYGEVFQNIDEELSMEKCRYVLDVLDMHRIMINSYDQLKDKAGIKPEDIKFRGFDGNNESELYSFATFLKDSGRYTETLTGGLNSHSMSTMTRYPMMLEKFTKIKEQQGMGDWKLTAEQIKDITTLNKKPMQETA